MKRILLATAAFAALPTLALAQEAETDLPEVVVTATRISAIVAETPGARVIDAATIERRGAVFAADILADVPGLSVVRTGAFGGASQVRIRGAHPGKTLVLVDGVPVNDPADVSGAFDFGGFGLADIARIEVLSGPQSSLWGSDAIGGVIAFTTRDTDGVRFDAEAGSFSTLRGDLAVGTVGENHAVSAWVSRFDTDGVSAADEADGNTEADGFDRTAVGAKGRYDFGGLILDAALRWSESHVDIDGYPAPAYVLADTPDYQDSESWSGRIGARFAAFGLNHAVSWAASDLTRDTVSSYPSHFEGERQVWRWQADGEALAGTLDYAFGAEHETAEGRLSTGLSEELSTSSVFATARLQATERLSVTAGLRHDETDDFGGETTGRLSAALRLDGGFTLSAAWGTGFKTPSISQAVCDYCYSAAPYPVLRPETAEGYEAALGWRSGDGRIEGRITAYRLKIDDQITYFTDTLTWDSYYVNIDRAATDGLELEGRALLGAGFDLTLAYAWTDARDETTGARLLRNPENVGSATLGWTGGRLSGALTVRAEGDQDDSGGVREGFVTANLNAAWAVNDQVTLTARIENLADERYQQVLGYGEPGRSGYVGIRLRY